MFAKLQTLFAAILLMGGCAQPDPVVTTAQSDFADKYPGVQMVGAGIRSRDADRVYVYVRYIYTPLTAFPPKAGIYETEMQYRRRDGKWLLVEVIGGRYIKPAS
jgi:hypothetical protein